MWSHVFLEHSVDRVSKSSDGGSSQNLRLFKRGKARPISGHPSIRGSSQFPKPVA